MFRPSVTIGLLFLPLSAVAAPAPIASKAFVAEATQFFEKEIAAHVAAVQTLEPPQATVLGVPTQGEFTWGSFMRALAEIAVMKGQRTIAGKDVPQLLGKLGLVEARLGGKTFSQLGGATALRLYGTDLSKNAVWRSLNPKEQEELRSLLDPGRFYDRQKKVVINLPENYFGVAARIVTMAHQMGLETDRAFVDDILERAAGQFLKGALYTDDALPLGRYDRYSQEYARYVYEAAGNVGRKDVQAKVEPSLKAVMRVWWDLVGADGYGYPWGRTIGAIGYMDSMEIVGFLADHPEFRPAPLANLASVFQLAWRWLMQDYHQDRHLLDMFAFGRGNYNYMTPARQWQQTTAFLGKTSDSFKRLAAALEREKVTSFPATPPLPAVMRFEPYRKGDRPAGVWLVRQGPLHFALPITTGPKAGIADYLPAPHGLPGFAAPVEQIAPALVPEITLADGRVVAASDCADEVQSDGKSLRAVWKRWVVVGGPPATLVDVGLTSEVSFTIEGKDTLVRKETITAARPTKLRKLLVFLPSTGDRVATRFDDGRRIDRFVSRDGTLEASLDASFPLAVTLQATGNSPLGRGHRGAIPLLLQGEATGIDATRPLTWTMRLRALGSAQ